ncbi:hypothetical protein CDO52_00945 [Nocardiopsis gilva YIM 90087]|uniref:Uncharacterized protein n=1 Tax=Nocardiopsis gilva YIM 90087 TaxID=1235441 RepID=A0A223S097_9ACTN|nr:hypothetical protein [Nocardiopsis gilva]ASU81546.1 hypothetical protein CDO52_00945 [Nocardiopsis gilva YIM 90087]
MRSLHRLITDAEVAGRQRLAQARRAWLGTHLIEEMTGHPERVRDPDPESQDEFDGIVLGLMTGDTHRGPIHRVIWLSVRAGWAR